MGLPRGAGRGVDKLFGRLDRAIKDAGCLPMSGQIVDASLAAAARQRGGEGGDQGPARRRTRSGRTSRRGARKGTRGVQDTDARWTVKTSKGKLEADGTVKRDIAIPRFGYKSHLGIDRRHGFIRRRKVSAAHEGAREGLIDPSNTASSVWAGTAYRSKANEDFLASLGKTSRIHRKKPSGKPMPERAAKANAAKSRIRARVEHVFAQQKERMNLMIRGIGLKRAEATIIMVNLACNLGR